MAILLHGTTRHRAERIVATRPDADAGERSYDPKEFWTCREECDLSLGTPEMYARNKANLFPHEGGPVILAVDVSLEIIALALDPILYPWEHGLIPFAPGHGLEELQTAWPGLAKEIRSVE